MIPESSYNDLIRDINSLSVIIDNKILVNEVIRSRSDLKDSIENIYQQIDDLNFKIADVVNNIYKVLQS